MKDYERREPKLYDFYKETDEVEIKIDRALIESLDGGSKQNAVY